MRNRPLSKADVLGLLSKAGEVSADDLAGLLAEEGFRDPGNDADAARLEAGGWLRRLYRQGLVSREEGQRTLQYRLPAQQDPESVVSRRQRVVLWKITEKGHGRLEWLRDHVSPAEPGVRAGKRLKRRSK